MNELFKLTELVDNCLKSGENIDKAIINDLKNIVLDKNYIGVAQINTKPGDIEYNAKKIARYIDISTQIGLESVIFPEMSLTGYPLGDVLKRHKIISDESIQWLSELAKLTKNTIVLLGFTENAQENKYYNSIAVMQYGKLQGVIRKCIFSNDENLPDISYYKPFSNFGFINIESLKEEQKELSNELYNKYAVTVSHDLYSNRGDDIEILLKKSSDLIVNCSALTLNQNRKLSQKNILSNISSKYKTPLIYVNQVGANDNIVFDGISCVYNSSGELIARAKAFEEQFMIVNPYESIGNIYSLPIGFDTYIKEQTEFSLNYEYDMERTYNALILGIKDYFSKCGFKRAVLGLSGGLDSTVCAVLLTDAIGKENVFGISMPSHITSNESTSDAAILANNLGINYIAAPIKNMINTTSDSLDLLFKSIESVWPDRYKKSFTPDNIQARSRAMFLWGVSNEFPNCIPIATSDKSEAYMGYATINGDMSGGFAPIADITKTKLFALARWLNKNRKEKNAIPESIILKKPGAELAIDPKTGKPLIAEDALMPYEFLDEVIWRIENKQEDYTTLLNSKFVYENNNKISKEQKIEWLDKFYTRMSHAFYKWSIMPPYVAIEPHSINKCDYYQLITSCGINYKGVSKEHIIKSLKLN